MQLKLWAYGYDPSAVDIHSGFKTTLKLLLMENFLRSDVCITYQMQKEVNACNKCTCSSKTLKEDDSLLIVLIPGFSLSRYD